MEEFFQKENRKTKPNRTENRDFFVEKLLNYTWLELAKINISIIFMCVRNQWQNDWKA